MPEGAAQNPSESLHSKIWLKCSKSKFSGRFRVLFVTRATVLDHNFGRKMNLVTHLFGTNAAISRALEEQDGDTERKGSAKKAKRKLELTWSPDYQPGAF